MSETVHYKGKAVKIDQPSDKNLIQVAEEILKELNKKQDDYYENAVECLCDEFCDEYFYYPRTQTLYRITKTSYDLENEIIRATVLDNDVLDYELRYYNGGAGFHECLEEAFDKLDIS